jgi:hypothetical protein
MRTGSPDLWDLAGSLGIVPTPPDPVLGRMLTSWLAVPPRAGCVSAGGLLWVAAPDPSAWCTECIGDRFSAERRCVYCKRRLALRRGSVMVFEVGESVRVLARCHVGCREKAAR